MQVVLMQMRLALMSRTLKEKRAIVKSVLGRARNRFNVSCCESGLHDQPWDAEIAFVMVTDTFTRGKSVMQQLESWLVEERPDVEITDVQVDEL